MSFVSAPFRGLLRIFEEVADQAEAEIFNEDAVKAELTDLYMRLEAGSLTEEEFGQREAELVTQLEAIEEHHQQKQRSRRGAR